MKKPLTILDFEFSGHHALHLRHLVRYCLFGTSAHITLLITRELFRRTYLSLSKPEQEVLTKHAEFLDDDPAWKAIHSRVANRSVACWLYFEVLNLRRRHERVLLMYMESIFYGMALSPLPRFDVSALMFRPTFYYRKKNMLEPGLASKGLFIVKWLSSFLCRIRPGIRKVFTLDPLAEQYARSVWHTNKFQSIPDPLGPEDGMTRPIGLLHAGPKPNLRLLLAGALSPRKGLKETVDALAACDPQTRAKVELVVIGEPELPFVSYVRNNLERAVSVGVKVTQNLTFVSDQEMDTAMEEADLVLVPYRGFKGSSGTVIRAAHFGKPVLSTDDGLMAYFVRTHQLGQAINVSDPTLFAGVLEDFIKTGLMAGFNAENARQYADSSEPRFFVDLLVGAATPQLGHSQ